MPAISSNLACHFGDFDVIMWVDQAVGAAGIVQDLSWSFVCPFYCGVSLVPLFALGLVVRLLAFSVPCARPTEVG